MNNPKKDHHFRETSAARVIFDVIGAKWSIPIIHILQKDTLRFHEIHKALPDTRQKVLTEALRKLERNGITQRTVYPTIPPQVEYKLTPLGQDLLKLSSILSDWVDMHVDEIKRAQRSYDRRKKP